MKFTIMGEEFELDFLDANEMEHVEDALKKTNKKIQEAKYVGLTQSQAIRKQCQIIFDFFDEVFGEGTHKRIFKGKCNLAQAINSFAEFIDAKNKSANEIRAITDKYSPNRAQRRATNHSGGNNAVKFHGKQARKKHHG